MPDILHLDQYQVVNQYIYLGALISNEGGCSHEIVYAKARQTAKSLQKENTQKLLLKH